MRLVSGLAAAAAIAIGVASAAPASSAVYAVTVRGSLQSGYDNDNTFGLGVGANLAGRAFEAIYSVDSSKGSLDTSSLPFLINRYADGGAAPVSATFRLLDGGAVAASGVYGGGLTRFDQGDATSGFYVVAASDTSDPIRRITINTRVEGAHGEVQGLDLEALPDYGGVSGVTISGYVFVGERRETRGDFYIQDVAYATYSTTYFSAVPVGGAVPEPAAWALMIGGFGLAGATLRRRALLAA